jgi:stage II sporulation protein GA (sporulation sigma-E factor processing peptidase)
MRYIVYIDVFILINLIMNFTILAITARLAQIKTRLWRVLIGAALGAFYSLVVFATDLGNVSGFIGKVIFSLIMIICVFAPVSWRRLARATIYFYLVSFVAGGAILALSYLVDFNGLIARGMRVLDSPGISWWILPLGIVVLLIGSKSIWFLYNTKLRESYRLPLTVKFAENTIMLEGLIDTGNHLQDPLSRSPVIIAEYESVRQLFSPELCNIFEKFNSTGGLEQLSGLAVQNDWYSKLRFIPYSSLGRKKGVMLGFKPDEVIINHNGKLLHVEKVVIGVCSRHLSPEGNYHALLHPDLVAIG